MNAELNKMKQPRAGGFTLVELIATIVILAILASVAVPSLFENATLSQRGYIDEVASSLRYAQRIAIASNCEVSFTIGAAGYTANQRNTLNNCNNAAAPWTTAVQRADGGALSGIAPGEVTMAPVATIVFGRDGNVTNGNPPVFAVGPFTMAVDATSGRVTVLP